jgi:hypothetical protein
MRVLQRPADQREAGVRGDDVGVGLQ